MTEQDWKKVREGGEGDKQTERQKERERERLKQKVKDSSKKEQ